ncbi:MAG: hypothetical protein LBF01_05125, partial [Bacteroidales bacterium]|nr:hypothetical protein [Bacteroidales bacterium]
MNNLQKTKEALMARFPEMSEEEISAMISSAAEEAAEEQEEIEVTNADWCFDSILKSIKGIDKCRTALLIYFLVAGNKTVKGENAEALAHYAEIAKT